MLRSSILLSLKRREQEAGHATAEFRSRQADLTIFREQPSSAGV
jgi:hypothetical protein